MAFNFSLTTSMGSVLLYTDRKLTDEQKSKVEHFLNSLLHEEEIVIPVIMPPGPGPGWDDVSPPSYVADISWDEVPKEKQISLIKLLKDLYFPFQLSLAKDTALKVRKIEGVSNYRVEELQERFNQMGIKLNITLRQVKDPYNETIYY